MPRGTQQSPWVWQCADYTETNVIRITVAFDNTIRVLSGATVFRDAACVYTRLYVGVGPSGTPNDTPMVFPVPAGTTQFTAAQMAAIGLRTIEDILSLQVTAGP